MEGVISNFRRNRHTPSPNHMIVVVEGVDRKDKADALVGKEVMWKSTADKEINGKVASTHGNKGAVRVIFETGMPGQSLGQKVQIK